MTSIQRAVVAVTLIVIAGAFLGFFIFFSFRRMPTPPLSSQPSPFGFLVYRDASDDLWILDIGTRKIMAVAKVPWEGLGPDTPTPSHKLPEGRVTSARRSKGEKRSIVVIEGHEAFVVMQAAEPRSVIGSRGVLETLGVLDEPTQPHDVFVANREEGTNVIAVHSKTKEQTLLAILSDDVVFLGWLPEGWDGTSIPDFSRIQKKIGVDSTRPADAQTMEIPAQEGDFSATATRWHKDSTLFLTLEIPQQLGVPRSNFHAFEVFLETTLEKVGRSVYVGTLQRDKDQTWFLRNAEVEDPHRTLNEVLVVEQERLVGSRTLPILAHDARILFRGVFPTIVQTTP